MFIDTSMNLEELDLEGFKVVKSTMFTQQTRSFEPMCTLWPSKISFNKAAIQALNNCEYIRIEVNPQTKGLLVIPVSSKDVDCIQWIKGLKNPTIRNMESRSFGAELYKSWGLDPNLNYRTRGRLVTARGKVLLFFSFENAEAWESKKGVNDK